MLLPLYPQSSGEHPRFAEIILPLNLPKTLTYGIPSDLQGLVKVGARVEVTLGANKQHAGLVTALHDDAPEAFDVKPIRAVIDDEPVVNDTQLRFWEWIGHYYMATPGEVMGAALPAHLKLQNETRLVHIPQPPEHLPEWTDTGYLAYEALELRKELSLSELRMLVGQRALVATLNELLESGAAAIDDGLKESYRPRYEKVVTLAEAFKGADAMEKLFAETRGEKQIAVLQAYASMAASGEVVRQTELLQKSGAAPAQVRALAQKGVFIIEEKVSDRLQYSGVPQAGEIQFTPAQQTAYDTLNEGLEEKGVALLHGVTGSGKTLLYIQKIREAIAEGKQAILLLPEIGLTTQLVRRLYAYFGEELGVYHSRFSDNERIEIWEKVRAKKYTVVVGPRSALWLPYDKLGLIIADEEHDPSYKQRDPAPRFHARDAAVYLAALHSAKVILGSATPSVESLWNVQQGKYALSELKERYQGVNMPVIEIINAKSLELVRAQGIRILTPELIQATKEALEQKRQVILFQNRRGYAPFQMCTLCGHVPGCRNCAVSLTYHKSTDKLHCHYCGARQATIHTCPQCGSNKISARSFGTEKIEEEVQKVFPDARVARMDWDSMRAKQSLPELLDRMKDRRIDILVGTQMVVKGLDFAPVALVGVLSADALLSYPDFRVNERAFQLMEQVSGRAGRADGKGRVIIQAYNLQHPTLAWVQAHDVAAFFEHELRYRELFGYPPFSRLLKLAFKHRDDMRAGGAAMEMAEALSKVEGIQVQGPAPALIARVRNLFVHEVWVKMPRDRAKMEEVKSLCWEVRRVLGSKRGNGALGVGFDVDPG